VPFSLGSYLLGVGTVVGALAFGFGSGVLLTSAPKTAAAPTKSERVARAEPKPAAQQEKPAAQQEKPAAQQEKPPVQQDTRENLAPPAEPAVAAPHHDPVPAAQPAAARPEAQREAESAKQSKPAVKQPAPEKQAYSAKPGEPANQTEQKEAVQRKTAERKSDRRKRYADYTERQDTERNAKSSFAGPRMRQPPPEQRDEPERAEFAAGREAPHFDLFRMLNPRSFVPPYDWAPDDGDD